MRIVSAKEFEELPAGTVFAFFDGQPEYPELMLQGLHVKIACDTLPHQNELNDVTFAPLSFPVLEGEPLSSHRSYYFSYIEAYEQDRAHDLRASGVQVVKEGNVDNLSLFLVYDATDLRQLISRLQQALTVAEQHPAPVSNVITMEPPIDLYVRLCVRGRVWGIEANPVKEEEFTRTFATFIEEAHQKGEEMLDLSSGPESILHLPKSALKRMHEWFDSQGVASCRDWSIRSYESPKAP